MPPVDGMFRPVPKERSGDAAGKAAEGAPARRSRLEGPLTTAVDTDEPGDDAGAGTDAERTPDSGLTPHDTELEDDLAAAEADRKRAEREEGRAVEGVEYIPAPEVPRYKVVGAIVLAIIIVLALYYMVIPRADAELVLQYNEGLLGGVNVDGRLENHGTRAIEGAVMTLNVQNSTDSPVGETVTFEGSVGAHETASLEAVSFRGDQWETYHIFVSWEFDCAGKHYSGTSHLSTPGEDMNVWFTVNLA